MAEKRASDGIGGNDTGLNYKHTTVSHFGQRDKRSCHNRAPKCTQKLNTFVNRIFFYSSSFPELHTISFLHLTVNNPAQHQKHLDGTIEVPKSQPNTAAMEPAPSSEPSHSPQIQKKQSPSRDRP